MLNDAQRATVAQILYSKRSEKVVPAKLFPILIIMLFVGWLLIFIGSGEVSVSLILPILVLGLYFTCKKNGTLDTSPDNLVVREFEAGRYNCKVYRALGFYTSEDGSKNIVRFQTETGAPDECEYFGQPVETVVVLNFAKGEKRAFSFWG